MRSYFGAGEPPDNFDPRGDAELLAAHVAGDRHAFAELISRHHSRLYRVARRTSRTAEDANEALQEALLAAHRYAGSVRHDTAVGGWLHRIVVNACRDQLRRTKRNATTIPIDDSYPVADRTSQIDTALVVRTALMQLSVEQRAAVVAVDMQGYSVADTAALLGVAPGTVKSRRARARERLAGLLSQLNPSTSLLPGT